MAVVDYVKRASWNMVTIGVRLPEHLRDQLKQECSRLDVGQSEVLRRLIVGFVSGRFKVVSQPRRKDVRKMDGKKREYQSQ